MFSDVLDMPMLAIHINELIGGDLLQSGMSYLPGGDLLYMMGQVLAVNFTEN